MHKAATERHRKHIPYADTGVLQTLSEDSALKLALTNGACNQGKIHFICSISSLDIKKNFCLHVIPITCDFYQK